MLAGRSQHELVSPSIEEDVGGNGRQEQRGAENGVARVGRHGAHEQQRCRGDERGRHHRISPDAIRPVEIGPAAEDEHGDAAKTVEEPGSEEAAGEKLVEPAGEDETDRDHALRQERRRRRAKSGMDAASRAPEETRLRHRI